VKEEYGLSHSIRRGLTTHFRNQGESRMLLRLRIIDGEKKQEEEETR
jgi:hypothetical protein